MAASKQKIHLILLSLATAAVLSWSLAKPQGLPVSRPRIFLNPARVAELRGGAEARRPSYVNWTRELCKFYPPRASGTAITSVMASGFALLYALRQTPCGGDVASYAAAADFYALRAIDLLNFQPTEIVSVSGTNPLEIVTQNPHRIAPGTGETVVIAGGEGAWGALNNTFTATADDTDPRKLRLSCDSTSLRPCSTDFSNAGAYESLSVSLFKNHRVLQGLNQTRYYYHDLALAYDWAYEGLSGPGRTRLRNFLKYMVTHRTVGLRACTVDSIGSNLCLGGFRAGLYGAIALHGDWNNGWNGMSAQSAYDAHRETWMRLAPEVLSSGHGSGGFFYEGPEYSPQTIDMHLAVMEAVLSVTGENWADQTGGWPMRVLEATAHGTSPAKSPANSYEPVPYSDVLPQNQRRFLGNYSAYMRKLVHLLKAMGREEEASHAKFWLEEFAPAQVASREFDDFLFDTSGVAAVDYREAWPTAYRDTGLNIVVSRSDWGPEATWVHFQSGKQVGGSHHHQHAGNFGVYRKGEWLTAEITGWGGTFASAWLHNTLTINHQPTNAGAPSMPLYENTDEYTYARADLGSTYRAVSASLSAYRDFLYLRPGLVVIADHIRSPDAAQTASFLLNFSSAPRVEGRSIHFQKGGQQLVATVIEPEGPSLHVRNQDRFHVVDATPGDSTAITVDSNAIPAALTLEGASGDWAGLNGSWNPRPVTQALLRNTVATIPVNTSGVSASFVGQEVSSEPGTRRYLTTPVGGYRAEIQSVGRSTEKGFFVVLQASEKDHPEPEPRRLAARHLYSAEIGDRVISAALRQPSESEPLLYRFEPRPHLRHIIFGLDPGATYKLETDEDFNFWIRPGGEEDRRPSAAGVIILDTAH